MFDLFDNVCLFSFTASYSLDCPIDLWIIVSIPCHGCNPHIEGIDLDHSSSVSSYIQ